IDMDSNQHSLLKNQRNVPKDSSFEEKSWPSKGKSNDAEFKKRFENRKFQFKPNQKELIDEMKRVIKEVEIPFDDAKDQLLEVNSQDKVILNSKYVSFFFLSKVVHEWKELNEVIGRGANSVVFKAKDLPNRKWVAIKQIS